MAIERNQNSGGRFGATSTANPANLTKKMDQIGLIGCAA
jgi:hypothetical protein